MESEVYALIYTVTFNPSLDYVVDVPALQLNGVNRTRQEALYPGGKGINVSIVLNNLGCESVALGFTAGFTGQEIAARLAALGCRTDFIPCSGLSRINVKIRAGEECEINGRGPTVTRAELEQLLGKLEQLQAGDSLVLAGAAAQGMGDDVYGEILQRLENRDIRTVVDATGPLLKNTLRYRPFLIKPNRRELEALFETTISDDELISCARALQAQGAQNVLVSLGGAGAIFVCSDGSVQSAKAPCPGRKAVNSVGAGDSMVAGFLAGYLAGGYQQAFRTGLAAGSATAFSPHLATKQEIEDILTGFCLS